MQIRCTNEGTKAIKLAKFGGLRIEFSKNGYATVPDDVGKYCVRKFRAIEDTTKKTKVTKGKEAQSDVEAEK